jgi:hypothetical protein
MYIVVVPIMTRSSRIRSLCICILWLYPSWLGLLESGRSAYVYCGYTAMTRSSRIRSLCICILWLYPSWLGRLESGRSAYVYCGCTHHDLVFWNQVALHMYIVVVPIMTWSSGIPCWYILHIRLIGYSGVTGLLELDNDILSRAGAGIAQSLY